MNTASCTLLPIIKKAQSLLSELIIQKIPSEGMSQSQYICYLTMQYHLNKGVQVYFMNAAASAELRKFRRLRQFLFNFAKEEELHFLVAANDIRHLGANVGPMPIDVALWHAYFGVLTPLRPFVRLGAACVLENAGSGLVKPQLARALSAPFLSRANTKYIVLHQHETVPHGDQILAALDSEHLQPNHLSDLVEGAQTATILYLRMAESALDPRSIGNMVTLSAKPTVEDSSEIAQFDMAELDLSEA